MHLGMSGVSSGSDLAQKVVHVMQEVEWEVRSMADWGPVRVAAWLHSGMLLLVHVQLLYSTVTARWRTSRCRVLSMGVHSHQARPQLLALHRAVMHASC